MEKDTIVINFSGHPLTDEQREQLADLLGEDPSQMEFIKVRFHLNWKLDIKEQIRQVADAAGLSEREWQDKHILIVPPGLGIGAWLLAQETASRAKRFLPMVAIRPVDHKAYRKFEVYAVVYQEVCDVAL